MKLFGGSFYLLKSLNTHKSRFGMLFLKIFYYFRPLKILQPNSEHIPGRRLFKLLKNECVLCLLYPASFAFICMGRSGGTITFGY